MSVLLQEKEILKLMKCESKGKRSLQKLIVKNYIEKKYDFTEFVAILDVSFKMGGGIPKHFTFQYKL